MTNSNGKDPNAVALGQKGGQRGGHARAEKLTPEQRKAIGQRGAEARWAAARALKGDSPPSAITDAQGRKTHIKVLLTEAEREALEHAAKPSGQGVSTWVRTVALERARSV